MAEWRVYFDAKPEMWPDIAYEIDDLFDTFVPHLAAALDHVRALKKSCRSVALLALVAIFVAAGKGRAMAAAVLVILLMLGLLVSARSHFLIVVLGIVSGVGISIYGCCPDSLAEGAILSRWRSRRS
ncbi:MAG TPA: hypothetical protein VJ840_12260 [Gemmatimonadaceae bacterium]|nr:hypothetical protein [Gemmatimonadaceae bacterium]